MAKLLGDVKDYEDYKQKIVHQRQLKKKTVESVKKYLQFEKDNNNRKYIYILSLYLFPLNYYIQ